MFVKFIPNELIFLINKFWFNAIPLTWNPRPHSSISKCYYPRRVAKTGSASGGEVTSVSHAICTDELQMYFNIKIIPEEK